MDTLQQLASTKFALKFFENTKVTISRPAAKAKLDFNPQKSSEIFHATEPLFMFAALDDSIEQIIFELNQWSSNNLHNLVFESDPIVLYLKDFHFNNLLINSRKTALNLSSNESLLLDDRLILSINHGWFEKAKEICDKNPVTKFKFETKIAMYRRLALGYLQPADIMSTVPNMVKFPMGFLLKIPVENFLSLNYIDTGRRLIVEYLYESTEEARKLLDKFFEKSGRIVSESFPILVSAAIPSFLNDFRRCDLLFNLAIDVCGEAPIRAVVEKWPGTTAFLDIDGLYLSMVRHPVLASNLIKLLVASNFNINWQTLVMLTRQNDFSAREIISVMPPDKLWWALSEENYELFYHLCDTNARKTITFIRDNVSQEQFETLVRSRNYSCFLSTCKRGYFLVVKLLTDGLNETVWNEVFGFQNYEGFFQATQHGYIAVVEWFGMLCSKFNMRIKYEEAHMITLKMLEIEARMLETALESLKLQRPSI